MKSLEVARERESRLRLARSQNRRKQALPAFAEGLRRVVRSVVDVESRLLPMPASADFERRLNAKLDELRSASALEEIKTSDKSRVGAAIENFFEQADEDEYAVFLSHWMHVGAVRLAGRELLNGLAALLEWDGDTVLGGTNDLRAIFLLDLSIDRDKPARYEFTYWRKDR